MYLLGYDIGSSSIKVALIEASTGKLLKATQFPAVELDIISTQDGWAEQDPETWWKCLCHATKDLLSQTKIPPASIKAIGIAYQMHGLVVIDKNQRVLRPAIIWCDSRAVEIGKEAFSSIGERHCLRHYLNAPGNFTASKLKWVKENEPETYAQIDKILLPGDYIAMKLSGECKTTISGLSEGIFWDFEKNDLAHELLIHYELNSNYIPEITDTFTIQSRVHQAAAEATGLSVGTPISYRAGDQPNNALSLGVFHPNEVAATGGTSGVVYGVTNQLIYDEQSRINGFAHVNHTINNPRIGLLLCINGAGSQYAWMKKQIAQSKISYTEMEASIASIPVGSAGLRILPFGNGAERMLGNKNIGAQINNLQFNRHTQAHLYRAALEGIAFSFVYGFQVLKELGMPAEVIKVGNDNLFQSPVFSQTIANLIGCNIEVIKTTGAIGAARASGVGLGIYEHLEDTANLLEVETTFRPSAQNEAYEAAFHLWKKDVECLLTKKNETA